MRHVMRLPYMQGHVQRGRYEAVRRGGHALPVVRVVPAGGGLCGVCTAVQDAQVLVRASLEV